MNEMTVTQTVVHGDIIIHASKKCAIYLWANVIEGKVRIKKTEDKVRKLSEVAKRWEKIENKGIHNACQSGLKGGGGNNGFELYNIGVK